MPFNYDARADTLSFVNLPRDAQRAAVFLDRRFIGDAFKSPPARIRDLPLRDIRDGAGPIHFIFHTGFCCSTLLARALDVPGVSMGLKEPAVLVSFAQHWSNARQTPGALNALGVTLDLLSRPLAPGETQIVKPTNVANHLLPEILHLRPDAKILVLYSGLRPFLEAIVRRDANGRLFGRQIFQGFASAIPLETTFSVEEQLLLTDLQIAAQAWLMQTTFFASLAGHHGRARIRTLNSDTLLSDPARALTSLGEFFELCQKPRRWADVAASSVFREHAKEHGLPFDAQAHHTQLAAAGSLHANEINAVEAWARHLAQRSNAALALGDTLLA
jgi:hypothetical protein